MSENRRFDWDKMLEQEPEKPPIRAEMPRTEQQVEPEPMDFDLEPEFEDYDPRDYEEQQTVAIPRKERAGRSQAPVRETKGSVPAVAQEPGAEPPKQQTKRTVPVANQRTAKQPCIDILEGKVTPNQLVNAFIMSEIFGKPKSMRRGFRR